MRTDGVLYSMLVTAIVAALIAAFGSATASAAESPEMLVELERDRVYEGQPVLYRVTLKNVGNPREPDVKALRADFDVALVGQQSLGFSQTRIEINGRVVKNTSQSGGFQYVYRLTPRRTGVLTIPGPTTEADGKKLTGRDLTLTVLRAADQDVVRMEIHADRTTVYPMQPFTVTLSVAIKAMPAPFADENPAGVQSAPAALQIPWIVDEQLPKGLQPKLPWRQWLGEMEDNSRSHGGAGFNLNGLSRETAFALFNERRMAFLPPCEKVQLPDHSGKKVDYWQYVFRRTFVAQKMGQCAFGPASLRGVFATALGEAGRPVGEEIYAVARPLTIDVRDVPAEGRPDSYIGAVGAFQVSASLEPRKVKTGDPMTFVLTLSGEGALDDAVAPDLGKISGVAEHFKIYEATQQDQGNRRQFTYGLRPLDAGMKKFPAVPVSYFNVDAGKYVTIQTDPIPIEVTKAVRLAGRDIVAAPRGFSGNGKEVESRREGIFANIADVSQLDNETIRPERWAAAGGGLVAAYGLAALAIGRWRRRRGDTAAQRRRAAPGLAKRRLREAAAEFAAGRTREGAEHVQNALLGLASDTLALPAAGLTSAELCRRLEASGADPELLERLRALLGTCEAARYGASDGASASLGRDAQKLLRPLTKLLLHCVFLVVLLLSSGGCHSSVDVETAKKFQAAQQAFDEARKPEDFAKAAALYQEILDRNGPSGAVLYNQGNAWMRAGQPGRAVAAYRQAQRYRPRDPYLADNLQYALGPDAAAPRRSVLETILFWQNWLSYPEKFYATAAAALVTFIVGLAGLFAAPRVLRRVAAAGLIATAVLAFSAGYDWNRFAATRHGVVVQSETVARKGNAASYEPAFTAPLHEATEFQVLDDRNGWLLVRLPGGGEGWIEGKAAATYY